MERIDFFSIIKEEIVIQLLLLLYILLITTLYLTTKYDGYYTIEKAKFLCATLLQLN